MRAMSSHWERHHRLWDRLGPPLRPHQDVTAAMERLLTDHARHVLLLGVSCEFANLGERLTAVDRSEQMIANIWPGDTKTRQAEIGDWLALSFAPACFSAVIGDGSLNVLAFPSAYRALFEQLERVLEPQGLFASRVYANPGQNGDTLASLRREALAGDAGTFNGFKLRLAMAQVSTAHEPNIRVNAMLDAFQEMFPDRRALCAASGWEMADIDTIDAYAGSPDSYSFPTREEIRSVTPDSFGSVRFVAVGHYDLAERCPLLIMERRG